MPSPPPDLDRINIMVTQSMNLLRPGTDALKRWTWQRRPKDMGNLRNIGNVGWQVRRWVIPADPRAGWVLVRRMLLRYAMRRWMQTTPAERAALARRGAPRGWRAQDQFVGDYLRPQPIPHRVVALIAPTGAPDYLAATWQERQVCYIAGTGALLPGGSPAYQIALDF